MDILLESASDNKQIILKQLYPKISAVMDKGITKFKNLIAKFIDARSEAMYEIAPYSRIYFSTDDAQEFFKFLGISEQEILSIISNTYYYPIAKFNPIAAKDAFTVAVLSIIRYFVVNKKTPEAELASIYLAFSGKFYPSIHYGSFPTCPPSDHREVMEYVVNNSLNQQFDLKREGSIFGAIKSRNITWLNTYEKEGRFKDFDDEDVVYLIQQLRDRIKSFIINVATVYYDVYKDKDSYLNYESDALGQDNYRIADNDMMKIERAVQNTMSFINGVNADYAVCKMSSNSIVRTDELKNIIELILQDNNNVALIKELVRILITLYFNSVEKKDLHDIKFVSSSISLKPNTKDKNVLRQKEIIEQLLDEHSPAYRKRKKRLATKNSYNKAVLSYFTLVIYNANK